MPIVGEISSDKKKELQRLRKLRDRAFAAGNWDRYLEYARKYQEEVEDV